MIKFKRHIKLGNQEFVTWFGLEIKKKGNKPNVSIFYYTDDPNKELSMHQLIRTNFSSKKEALQYGIKYMKRMYLEMINREKELSASEENTDIDFLNP